jgi:hypothetical protein
MWLFEWLKQRGVLVTYSNHTQQRNFNFEGALQMIVSYHTSTESSILL